MPGRDAQRLPPSGARVDHLERGRRPRADVGPERRHPWRRRPARRPGRRDRSRGRRRPGWPPPSRPGPPPVATVSRAPSAWPRRAASAYVRLPRSIACPPMTPTTSRPPTHSVRAAPTEWSWRALASASSGVVPAARPGVRPRVEGVVVARGVVEVAGGVERRAVGVDRDARDLVEDGAAGAAYGLVVTVGELAAEEQRLRERPLQQRRAALGEVEARPPASPASDLAPLASRRSRSASEVTSRTRPRECFTQATYVPRP